MSPAGEGASRGPAQLRAQERALLPSPIGNRDEAGISLAELWRITFRIFT